MTPGPLSRVPCSTVWAAFLSPTLEGLTKAELGVRGGAFPKGPGAGAPQSPLPPVPRGGTGGNGIHILVGPKSLCCRPRPVVLGAACAHASGSVPALQPPGYVASSL